MNKTQNNDRMVVVPVVPITQLALNLPAYGGVPAGFPSPAADFSEEELDLNQYLIRNPSATFFAFAEGDSMEGAGIFTDDILIIDRSVNVEPGKIIVAALDGELTVKRFIKRGGKYFLKSENPRYKEIELNEESNFFVWGVVIYTVHKR